VTDRTGGQLEVGEKKKKANGKKKDITSDEKENRNGATGGRVMSNSSSREAGSKGFLGANSGGR